MPQKDDRSVCSSDKSVHKKEVSVPILKKMIRSNLIEIGQQMYNALIDGHDLQTELYDLIIRSLPLCFQDLNTNSAVLFETAAHLRYVAGQLKQKGSMAEVSISSFKNGEVETDHKNLSASVQNFTGDADVVALKGLLMESLQSAAWYAVRAKKLEADLSDYQDGFITGLKALANPDLGLGGILSRVMEAGQLVFACAAVLSQREKENWGEKKITQVDICLPASGSLVVAGGDMEILADVLRAAKSHNVTVYTFGALGVAHGYPGIAAAENLRGHVDYEQLTEALSRHMCILYTDFSTATLENDGKFYKAFTTGLAGQPGNAHLDNVTGNDGSQLWTSLAEIEGIDLGEKTGCFHTGYGYAFLHEKKDEIITGLQEGTIKMIEIELSAGTGNYTANRKISGSWRIFAGGQPENEMHSFAPGENIHPVHIGAEHHMLEAVAYLNDLAMEMHCSLEQIPYRFVFRKGDGKLTGLLVGMMSLGFKGFLVEPDWKSKVTGRVWNTLQDRFDVQLYEDQDKNHND